MDREQAEELVRAYCLSAEESTGNPPEELRVSEDIYVAIANHRSHAAVQFEGVALYLDLNLEPDVVEDA
jgi:hypothetical protein